MKRIEAILMLVLITVCMTVLFAMGMRSQRIVLILSPVLVLLTIFGFSKPETIFLLAVAISSSQLVPPGLSGQLELYHVFLSFVCGVLLIRALITREAFKSDPGLRVLGGMYAFVVFYTMLARGIGFLALGQGQAGGMRYVMIYVGFLVVLLIPNLRLELKHLKTAIYVSIALSLLPGLAELLFILSRGKIYHQYNFIEVGSGVMTEMRSFASGGATRFKSLGSVGRAIVVMPFFIFPLQTRYRFHYALLIFLGLGTSGLSGYRSEILRSMIFLFVIGFILMRKQWVRYCVFCVGLVSLGTVFLYISFDIMPYGVQRAFSFLPFIGDGTLAALDAGGTTNFRLGVWAIGFSQIPDYLLLGRGLAFDWNERMAVAHSSWMGAERLYQRGAIGNFHNGPLEALVYLGLPGFILLLLYLGRIGHSTWKLYIQELPYTTAQRFVLVYAVLLFTNIVMFFITFGNPYATFLLINFYISMIYIIRKSLENSTPSDLAQPDMFLGNSAGVQ